MELHVTRADGTRVAATAVTLVPGDGIPRRNLTRGLPKPGSNIEHVGIIVEGELVAVACVDDKKTFLHFHPTKVLPEYRAFPEDASRADRPLMGIGRALVAEIVRRSFARGYEGHVTTLTAHRSKGFFQKLEFGELNEVARILAGEAVNRYRKLHEPLYGSFS